MDKELIDSATDRRYLVTAAAVVAANMAMATKASGTIVRVEPEVFLGLLQRQENPLVIHARTKLANRRYRYLTSYKGLAFFTKSKTPLSLPSSIELVEAKEIWIP